MMAGSGFLRITGNYLEVVPPIFANYLAERTLAGRPAEIARLFLGLPALGRVRLLKRLRQLRSDAVQAFWDELFRTGPLSTFGGALAEVPLLRLVAPAAPARIARLIRAGLAELSLEERRAIEGNIRRELVWAIDQLLFRSQTAQSALRSLALLAEAENEHWSNNSAGVFAECFHPLHPQLPLPVAERFAVLRDLLGDGPSKPRKLLALKAAEEAFSRFGSVTLRHSEGADPFDRVPTVTYGEIREYSTLKYVTRAIPREGQFGNVVSQTEALLQNLDHAEFSVKLRRWLGSWEFGDEKQDINGKQVFRSELAIQRLAESAAADPNLVSASSLTWLTSADAKRSHEFLYWVGRYDRDGRWQRTVESLGEHEGGVRAFASYFGGRSEESPAEMEQRLDEVAAARTVLGSAIVGATGFLPGSARAIHRVVALINNGSVEAEVVERRLMAGGWMRPLGGSEASELLRAIAGQNFQRAALVIDFLAMWVHASKPIEGELAEIAWRALESTPETGEAWDYDLVAAAIAPTDYDRAFELLRRYLTLPHGHRSWEPLDRHGGNRFWSTIWRFDPGRCIEVLLQAGAASLLTARRINWHLPEVLDLVRDRDVLLRFARQSEANAEFASSSLASKEGFWPVAVEILALHPGNERIRRNISAAAEHMNRVVVGPSSENYSRWSQEVDAVAADPATPNSVRPFLRDLAIRFHRRSEDEHRAEQNERVNW